MKYKHIVFDVDGTLVDTAQTALTCLQRVLYEETGRQIDLETLYPLFGIPCLELAIQFGTPDPARAVLKWQEYDRQQLKNVRLFSGITQMLDVLHRTGCRLGKPCVTIHKNLPSTYLTKVKVLRMSRQDPLSIFG